MYVGEEPNNWWFNDENHRERHTDGRTEFFRHAEERAEAEELTQHYIIDEGGADKD